ncbi:unnamed product [Ostreococcus tauri]|uniref:Unnamed product n=1 Tax=Ostreococcus tauri TaxID=70448 RepID=Q010U4_OSTTA|nr:unnamed product [Ostreococcus tauri]CAL55586.1 unnamed product [Ostreococcus tauri]|eukprot:XP_003081417.1 unnamed product [Ostreococcus tauri]
MRVIIVGVVTGLAVRGVSAQADDTFVSECAGERLRSLVEVCTASENFNQDTCCASLRALDENDCFCNVNLGQVELGIRREVLPLVLQAEQACDLKLKFGNNCAALPPFTLSPPSAASPPAPSAIISPSIVPAPIRATCSVDGLVRLIQGGCASIGDNTNSPLATRVRASCCEALTSLNAEKCFCSEGKMVQELLREFPSNFLAMFSASESVCGTTIVGGWQCLPFVAKSPPPPPPPPPPSVVTPPIIRAPLPPFVGRTFGVVDREELTRQLSQELCRVSAYANILDDGCARLPFLDATSNRARRCCEQIALMNTALCFCELSDVVQATKSAADVMFSATQYKCRPGFGTYAYEECRIVDAGPIPTPAPPPAPPPAQTGTRYVVAWWPWGGGSPASTDEPIWPDRPRVPSALLG